MQFELFRISMALRKQIDFDEYKLDDGRAPSREQWLRLVFKDRIDFSSNSVTYYFTPILTPGLGAGISGRVGRKTLEKENLPPDQKFAAIEREQWHAAEIFIDPTHHDDGQQIAFETKASVGSAHVILGALQRHLNESRPDAPYIIEIGPDLRP